MAPKSTFRPRRARSALGRDVDQPPPQDAFLTLRQPRRQPHFDRVDAPLALRQQRSPRRRRLKPLDAAVDGVRLADEGARSLEIGDNHGDRRRRQRRQSREVRAR